MCPNEVVKFIEDVELIFQKVLVVVEEVQGVPDKDHEVVKMCSLLKLSYMRQQVIKTVDRCSFGEFSDVNLHSGSP